MSLPDQDVEFETPAPISTKIKKSFSIRQLEGIRLLAEDKISDESIAKSLGVSRRTLANWKEKEDFAKAIERARLTFRNRVMSSRFAIRANRVEALNDLATRDLTIFRDRAAAVEQDPELKSVPGARTGLIFRTRRKRLIVRNRGTMIDPKGGPDGKAVVHEKSEVIEHDAEFEVDYGTQSEFRATLRQIAEETGDLKAPTTGRTDLLDEMLAALAGPQEDED